MKRLLLVISILLLNSFLSAEPTSLSLENSKLIKTFFFNRDKPGPIKVAITDREDGQKMGLKEAVPYFEFVIDNQWVTSESECWIFKAHTERKMGNAGTEHRIVFEGKAGAVDGMRLVLLQQLFPESTLIREKLILQSTGKTFKLNKMDGELHFQFPGYSFPTASDREAKLTEVRIATWNKKPITFGDRTKGNHMYYPNVIEHDVRDRSTVKGPIAILSDQKKSYLIAYEHASQDSMAGIVDKRKLGTGNQINDAMQGVKGSFDFSVRDEDLMFLGIASRVDDRGIHVSVDIERGGYLDGEAIDPEHPYATVWVASGFYKGANLDDGKAMIREYLLHQIIEKPASREPEFYYNTWGMQRQDRKKPLRGILTYERIFEEIDHAAELGVDIFVLDDGWNNTMGEWFPNKERLSEGLEPIKKRLDEYGIKMGLWYSPMGIDKTTERYKQHPEWVIKDSKGKPILAQWNHPAFDFVGGFFDLFVADCKAAIDQGCLFMKWDAINTFYSSLPNLDHGSDQYPEAELRARYEYLLPIYVVRAMEILTDYEPDLVIEVDLTEARRVMVGLAPLSQGKFFWMNNGASWYNDYTTKRTKSMRTIANEFAGWIPLELFTYANYPHDIQGAMEYNVHNSLLAGHGFWGNLELMTTEQRNWVGQQVKQSKEVLPHLLAVNPVVIGEVGDSPEIYALVNEEKAAGQIIAFSEKPSKSSFSTPIKSEKLLAVMDHPFSLEENQLHFEFDFENEESSKAVFILPNQDEGVSILSSTSAITRVEASESELSYLPASPGEQIIRWQKDRGIPAVQKSNAVGFEMDETSDAYLIKVKTTERKTAVKIYSTG